MLEIPVLTKRILEYVQDLSFSNTYSSEFRLHFFDGNTFENLQPSSI